MNWKPETYIEPLKELPQIGQLLNLYDNHGNLLYAVEVVGFKNYPATVQVKCRLRVSGPDLPEFVWTHYVRPGPLPGYDQPLG